MPLIDAGRRTKSAIVVRLPTAVGGGVGVGVASNDDRDVEDEEEKRQELLASGDEESDASSEATATLQALTRSYLRQLRVRRTEQQQQQQQQQQHRHRRRQKAAPAKDSRRRRPKTAPLRVAKDAGAAAVAQQREPVVKATTVEPLLQLQSLAPAPGYFLLAPRLGERGLLEWRRRLLRQRVGQQQDRQHCGGLAVNGECFVLSDPASRQRSRPSTASFAPAPTTAKSKREPATTLPPPPSSSECGLANSRQRARSAVPLVQQFPGNLPLAPGRMNSSRQAAARCPLPSRWQAANCNIGQ